MGISLKNTTKASVSPRMADLEKKGFMGVVLNAGVALSTADEDNSMHTIIVRIDADHDFVASDECDAMTREFIELVLEEVCAGNTKHVLSGDTGVVQNELLLLIKHL